MMEVPGTVLPPETICPHQHPWAHRTSSEPWPPAFPKRHVIFVPLLETCQPTDTSLFGKNAGSARTEKRLHAALLRALANRDVTQRTRLHPRHLFGYITPCRCLVFPALSGPSSSFHSLSRRPRPVAEGEVPASAPRRCCHLCPVSHSATQTRAATCSVGGCSPTLLRWVATTVQARSAFPSSSVTCWSLHAYSEQLMTQKQVWHIQAVIRHKTSTVSPKKMLQINSIFVQEYI